MKIALNGEGAGAKQQPASSSLRAEFWSLPPEAFIDRRTAAAGMYLTVSALEVLAIKGGGPRYTRIGRRALYRKGDVLAWASETGRTVANAAQLAGAAR